MSEDPSVAPTSNQGPGTVEPSSDKETSERKSRGQDPDKDRDSGNSIGAPQHRWLTFLFWVFALTLSAFVAFSNHWLADMILALLPIGLIVGFSAFGLVMLLRKR